MTHLEQVISSSERLSKRTKQIYLGAVKNFVGFAGTDPSNWNGFTVADWRSRRKRQVKEQTANLELIGLKYASKRYAALLNNPQADFAWPVEKLKIESQAVRKAIPFHAAQAMVDHCTGFTPVDIRDRAILVLAIKTGMRRAGMAGIKFSDISGNKITITLKGGRKHPVYVDPETQTALAGWAQCLADHGIKTGHFFRGIGAVRPDGTYSIGKSISGDGLNKIIKKRAAAAGIRNVTPHVLRHTFVSACVDQGLSPARIMAVTGHKSESMIRLYTTDTAAESDPVGGYLPSLLR